MSCPQCAIPYAYNPSCRECTIRHLSRSIGFWESERAGKMSARYKADLMRVFGEDWKKGHKEVKLRVNPNRQPADDPDN